MFTNRKVSTKTGLLLILAALILTIVVKEVVSIRSQIRMLDEAKAHIAVIQDDWERFQLDETGVSHVALAPFTNPIGSISASGPVKDEETILQIRKFLEKTNPPHGISLRGLRIVNAK